MELRTNLTDKALRDYKLVQKAVSGDQKAFAELMKYYKDAVYFMLLKMTNNEDDAKDLTIEAFGKAFNKIDQYTPDYAFSTWLFRIASNNCIDFIRKKRKDMISIDTLWEQDDSAEEINIEIPCSNPTPEERYIKKQKIKILREMIEKLKPQYKMLIEMRYFQELSYEEIAEELNLPLGTVKAQLFRAREMLYQLLNKMSDNI